MKTTEVTKQEAKYQVHTVGTGTGKIHNTQYFLTLNDAYAFADAMSEILGTVKFNGERYGVQVMPIEPTPAELLLGMF